MDLFITSDTGMAGHPTERDCLAANGQSKKPVLNFLDKRVWKVKRLEEIEGVAGVCEDGESKRGERGETSKGEEDGIQFSCKDTSLCK